MPKVFFVNEFRTVEVPEGANLRTVALENGIHIDREQLLGLNCNNRGYCGVCKVWVKEKTRGATNPRGFKETHLFFRYFKGWQRLGCMVEVRGDIDVWTTPGGRDRREARDIQRPPTPSEGAIPPPPEPEKPQKPQKAAVAKQGEGTAPAPSETSATVSIEGDAGEPSTN